MPLEKERSGPPWGVRTWGGYTAPFQCYGYERLGNGKAGIMLYKKMLRKQRRSSTMCALIQESLKGTELAKMLSLIVKKKFLSTIEKGSPHVQQSLSLDPTAILCNAGGGGHCQKSAILAKKDCWEWARSCATAAKRCEGAAQSERWGPITYRLGDPNIAAFIRFLCWITSEASAVDPKNAMLGSIANIKHFRKGLVTQLTH